MGMLLVFYEHDERAAAMFSAIVSNQVGGGFCVEISDIGEDKQGKLAVGQVIYGITRKTFSAILLKKGVGALRAARRLGYEALRLTLIATATQDQIKILEKRKISMDSGFALLIGQTVPLVCELENALLITGEAAAEDLARVLFRRFVFSHIKTPSPEEVFAQGVVNG